MKKVNFKPVVLYVEDEEQIRDTLSEFLEYFSSKLYIANDGKMGLELYKKYTPDIVISDINMPLLNGIDMIELIKKINPNQYVIFITAHNESDYFIKAIEMQVDGYILKPIDLDKLELSIVKIIHNIEQKNELDEYKNNLELKITEEIEKSKKQDILFFQQSKQAQLGEMLSMVAHQWRQPLNAISATSINLSLLSNMKLLKDEKLQEDSEFIQGQCQKMSETIETFMNFVRPSKDMKGFKLKDTIKSIISIMGVQLHNHNINIDISYKHDIELFGHEDLLEQVIINILSNARDAFEDIERDKKYIKIVAEYKMNFIIISIEDNAGGIPEKIQNQIFNPYFTTKEQGKGTGIGLYICMDIIKKSFSGDILYSSIDNGSKFKIVLNKGIK